MSWKLFLACFSFIPFYFQPLCCQVQVGLEEVKNRGPVGVGSWTPFGYFWTKGKGKEFVGVSFHPGKKVEKKVFFKGPRSFPFLSRSVGGRYLFSVKGKLFMLVPETGKTETVMEDKFSGLVEGLEVEGMLRVLEDAGPAPGRCGEPCCRVLQISIEPGNVHKKYLFIRPVLFSVSAGKRGVVGVLPDSKGDLEISLSQGVDKPGKKLGLVPREFSGGPISWALPSKKPRFLSLAFNQVGSGKDGLPRAFLVVVDLERSCAFTFSVKYKPPGTKVCPGPALAMGWYGGRYLLTSGVGGRWIDALYGKYVDFGKVREFLKKRGDDDEFSRTIGNFLVLRRRTEGKPQKYSRKYSRKEHVGFFILGKGISYADGEKVIIPGNEKSGIETGRLFSISPGGRFAFIYPEKGKRLWLVDGREKKVKLLEKNVFDWGWIK